MIPLTTPNTVTDLVRAYCREDSKWYVFAVSRGGTYSKPTIEHSQVVRVTRRRQDADALMKKLRSELPMMPTTHRLIEGGNIAVPQTWRLLDIY